MTHINEAGDLVYTGSTHNSVRKTRRCLPGKQHKAGVLRCINCGDWNRDYVNCWWWNCDDAADETYERTRAAWFNPYHDLDKPLRDEVVVDTGTCDWCMEKYRREDEHRDIQRHRGIEEAHLILRQRERQEAQRQKEMEWRLERTQRMELARQRALLREGRQTLTAIRRHLREPVSSRQQESRPERTSPI